MRTKLKAIQTMKNTYREDDYINYQQDSNERRTCTTIFRSIIRSDLIEYTRLLIEQTSTQCIQDVSNFTSNFSIQVFKVVSLMLYEHKFVLENSKVFLVHAGTWIRWLTYILMQMQFCHVVAYDISFLEVGFNSNDRSSTKLIMKNILSIVHKTKEKRYFVTKIQAGCVPSSLDYKRYMAIVSIHRRL